MDKLTDYIRWIGDLDFQSYPFRDADAMILCIIGYFDLSPVFKQEQEAHTVADCIPMIEAGEARLKITGGDMGNSEIFEAAARSKRFGSLGISDYTDQVRMDPPLQFSAVTFHAPDFSFIAYRGTDASIPGWRENCMISFTRTEGQALSLAYAEQHIHGHNWYIGGHSKGANLALFTACMLSDEQLAKVQHIYLLDGPGFCPEVLDSSLISRIDGKTTRIIPEYDVVGKLFEPEITDTKIIRSYRDGILQHSLASWLVEYGAPATVTQNDPTSVWIDRLLNDRIESIPQEDRPGFIGELFDALSAEGSESLEDLDLDRLQSVLIRLTGVSETTKETLSKLPGKVLFEDVLPELPSEDAGKWKTFFSDFRVHGLILTVSGIIAVFLSEFLFELTSMGLVFLLVAVQLVLVIRRLIRQRGKLDGLRERFFLLSGLLALMGILWFKEKALFLLGSLIYGILGLWAAYASIDSGIRQKEEPFLRVLHFVEGALAAIYGIGFLLIPQTVVHPFAGSMAVNIAIDGILRIVYGIMKKRRTTVAVAEKQ